MLEQSENTIWPVGARIEARDAEWRILSVDSMRGPGQLLKCLGLSNIVRGRVAYFFTAYENDSLRLLEPENTNFVSDRTPHYIQSRLYLESVLRTAPKTDNAKLYVSYKAAMDPMPYQFNPALQALQQPRPRILIADAVGIGKTLEAGILTSELIARGRAKRILVLATKAVLPQFQQEFWNRFSIPLTALDSAGIQRVRERIPANQNPFFYFDKAIISIDTLKKDEVYRELIKQAYWDLIIIDEAHNVAQRSNRSQRAKLAQLLSGRSDAMIMLTATPHDGKAESFASLLNVLDPTAIADPSNYTPEDFEDKGLVIRRFKSHIQDQIGEAFPKRKIEKIEIQASSKENEVLREIQSLTFATLDKNSKKESTSEEDSHAGSILFRTNIIKTFFSSPAACISLLKNRIKRLEERQATLLKTPQAEPANQLSADIKEDISKLEHLKKQVQAIGSEDFSKVQTLARMLDKRSSSIGWTGQPGDRVVVFTESIQTLDYLARELPHLAGLSEQQIVTLKGTMSDAEIAERVNLFNQPDSKVRVLLASDVASEGINLHRLAHRMIHFDIPWSLMTFQQRNGRIDRYGQKNQPEIYYLLTKGEDEQSVGDMRVLEVLIQKDQKAQENLKDPLEFLSPEEQENVTAQAMEAEDEGLDLIDAIFNLGNSIDTNADPLGTSEQLSKVLSEQEFEEAKAQQLSFFKSDMDFASQALRVIALEQNLTENELKIEEDLIDLQPPTDFANALKYLPPEIIPSDNHFKLTDNAQDVQNAMDRMLKEGERWPDRQLLWPNHPVMEWLEGRFLNSFGRNAVPLLVLSELGEDSWILLQGGYPNRRGYVPVSRFVAVRFREGKAEPFELEDFVRQTAINEGLFNSGKSGNVEAIKRFLPQALSIAKQTLLAAKKQYEAEEGPKLTESIERLRVLKEKHEAKILEKSEEAGRVLPRQQEKLNALNQQFLAAEAFERNNVELEEAPYIQVVAGFTGLAQE